jgi:fumarylpyruvate hydrolase
MTTAYSHTPHAISTVAIDGSEIRYPVRRIFCVGRNYADHAREMGSDPDREPPFFFTKFPDSVVPSGSRLTYPLGTSNYHYEMELVIALKDRCLRVEAAKSLDAVYGYACGLDMTRRDLQLEAREKGRPWDLGKSFEEAAVLAPLVEAARVPDIARSNLSLAVNGTVRQSTNIADMIWSSAEIISVLSQYYVLGPGDLIFTGTPAGVGAVTPGDEIRGEINGLPAVLATIGEAAPHA